LSLNAIRETAQTGTVFRVGAADTVIDHFDDNDAIGTGDVDRHCGRSRMFADVGEALRDHVIGGYLDRFGEAALEVHD
jgi:hypothetical protein